MPAVPALTPAGTNVSAVVEPGRNRRISPVTMLPTNSVPAGVAAMLSGKKLAPGTVRLAAFDWASRSRWVDAVAAGAHASRATARQTTTNARARRFMLSATDIGHDRSPLRFGFSIRPSSFMIPLHFVVEEWSCGASVS
jgi:hypothetical protein